MVMPRLVIHGFLLFAYGLFAFAAVTAHAEKELILGYTLHEAPPYVMHSRVNKRGIVLDIIDHVTKGTDFFIRLEKLPRKRLDEAFASGAVDMLTVAKEWVQNAERYLFTDTVIVVSDVIWAKKKILASLNGIEDLSGLTVAAPNGYHFARLNVRFAQGLLTRIDVSSVEVVLKMVASDRADVGVLSIEGGRWIKANQQGYEDIAATSFNVNSFELRLALQNTETLRSFLQDFNLKLKQMHEDGTYQRILDDYR